MDKRILIFFGIILLIVLFSDSCKCNINEHFDAKMIKNTKEECRDLCTSSYDCKGFTYDNNTKICYLGKNTMFMSSDFNSGTYKNEYNLEQQICNKKDHISSNEKDNITEQAKIDNASYRCIGMDGLNNITPGENMEYELSDYDWPSDKPTSAPAEYKPLEDEAGNKVYPASGLSPVKEENIPKGIEDQILPQNVNSYLVSSKIHKGQYVFPHQCVQNTPLTECLLACDNSDGCEGVEWNPTFPKIQKNGEYTIYRNVCCPKTNIKQIGERDRIYKYGNYYMKLNEEQKQEYINKDHFVLIK